MHTRPVRLMFIPAVLALPPLAVAAQRQTTGHTVYSIPLAGHPLVSSDSSPDFRSLGLAEPILNALNDAGYEQPTPIQARCIPALAAGRDLLGQAQTGTGKTAAFALPLLSSLDASGNTPQVLVLTPTRELAMQVAEAFQTYARHLAGVHVLALYGGQGFGEQLKTLRRGPQVIVGTPGRVMDHMRRGTLRTDGLRSVVLDEADEMLRMGFIDDVEWILGQVPENRQVALFSATMPDEIRRVSARHLRNAETVRIAAATATVSTIRQRYWRVGGLHKLDALTRLLETEAIEAGLIFVRTRTATVELAEKLSARGHACEALSGDVAQNLRERTVDRLKRGELNLVVATDVAARGLDVDRISHVFNYDIPSDAETYVHRIGRTGRAGRKGEAILFVAPREQRMLQVIERATRQPIEQMQMPTAAEVNAERIKRFDQRISETLAGGELEFFLERVTEYCREHDAEPLQVAAALARLAQGDTPLLLEDKPLPPPARDAAPRPERRSRRSRELDGEPRPLKGHPDVTMARFVIDVGHDHGVKPGNIVGAIANEAGMDSCFIGAIDISEQQSTVDLPADIPPEILHQLRGAWVCGRQLGLRLPGEQPVTRTVAKRSTGAPRGRAPRAPAPVKRGRRIAR